jgi:thymidylate synthase
MFDIKEWPMFYSKELVVGNKNSRVGVCVFWSELDKFAERHSGILDKVAVIGNLYSIAGIRVLIRNYLANPNLRYLLTTGAMLGTSLFSLSSLIDGSIISLHEKLFLEKDHINRFLNQVKIIPIKTGIESVISDGLYADTAHENKTFDQLVVPLPEPKADIFPGPQAGHLIRAGTISEGYLKLLGEIRHFGHITGEDSEGHKRQELWKLVVVITEQDPWDFASVPHPEYNVELIKKYCEEFWTGKKIEGVSYSYGHTIRFTFGDQVEAAIKAFKQKKETFRVFISLWDPHVEGGSIVQKDPHCLTDIQLRIIDNKLEQGASIRTNDMFSGWSLNAIMLRNFQDRFLKRLRKELDLPDLQLGNLCITSGSAHIYDFSWLMVDDALETYKDDKFRPDPKGNFEITTECNENEIVVHHYSPDGNELLQVFRGMNAEKMSAKIAPFVSEIRNALYIGRALKEAELKLKGGKSK